jgi:hypothetical protein
MIMGHFLRQATSRIMLYPTYTLQASKTCEYATFCGIRVFEYVIKDKTFRGRDYPRLFGEGG